MRISIDKWLGKTRLNSIYGKLGNLRIIKMENDISFNEIMQRFNIIYNHSREYPKCKDRRKDISTCDDLAKIGAVIMRIETRFEKLEMKKCKKN